MNHRRTAVLLLSTCAVVGCGKVQSDVPIGLKPVAQLQQIEGQWRHEKTRTNLFVRHLGEGKLVFATIGLDDVKRQFSFQQERGVVRRAGETLWLNIEDNKDGQGNARSGDVSETVNRRPRYLFYQLELAENGQRLRVWAPNSEKVAAIVQKGMLKGTVRRDGEKVHVHLANSAEELDEYFGSPASEACFHPTGQIEFTRVP